MRWEFLGLLLLLAACSPFRPDAGRLGSVGLQVIEGVPFRAQEVGDDCGPAALASLLAHRGRDLPVAQIAKQTYSPALGGTLLADLQNYAVRQGFAVRTGRGDLDLLRAEIDAGRPVLIPIETGFWAVSRPHYLVVFGYQAGSFLVHAGELEGVFIAAGELLRRWQSMSRLYLYLE